MKSNSMATLSARVHEQLQADRLAVKDQTRQLLQEHANSLKRLSAAALDTTQSVIQRQGEQLEQMHSQTLQRLRWLMLWPLLTSVSLSLLIVLTASGWAWWKVSQVDEQLSVKQQQIRALEAEFCASPAGQRVCKAR